MDKDSLKNRTFTKEINENQIKILKFVCKEVQKKGYPPSVREICRAVGFKSTSTVYNHLEKLKQMGYIEKDPLKPRAIKIVNFPANFPQDKNYGTQPGYFSSKELIDVPVVGKITAGQPILAVENIEDTFPIPVDLAQNGNVFMLVVQGESMVDAGILDGDMVLVKQQNTAQNGNIVAALIEDEATIKTFYREKDHIRLQPENKYMKPIIIKNNENISIIGKIIGVFRKL